MKYSFFVLLTLCICLLMIPATELSADPKPLQGTPRLYINGTEMGPKAIGIKYDITYAGFVELHLFDKNGKKVWIKGRVNDKVGSHMFPVPKKPLKSGERYSFILKYKGNDYAGSFYAE